MKLGGEFSRAPVLIHRLQGLGPRTTNLLDARPLWSTVAGGKSWKTANHPTARGAPSGGNFLCEDGHVAWRNANRVTLGSSSGDWQCIYTMDVGQ